MTKFLCIDFDGTLTLDEVAEKIKKLSDTLDAHPDEQIKIGIVTARGIRDDFVTYGQFFHDIQGLLNSKNIKVDFISTTFALHVINRDHYKHSIDLALTNAKVLPNFGDKASNYLAYRAANRKTINEICYGTRSLDELKVRVTEEIALEESLFNFSASVRREYGSAKITQINQIINVYKHNSSKQQEVEVLFIDDAVKHIRGINLYAEKEQVTWKGVFVNFMDLANVLQAVDGFYSVPVQLLSKHSFFQPPVKEKTKINTINQHACIIL